MRQQINEAETTAGLLLLVTKPYRLGYLKLAAPYLCEQDAALFLSYAWISTESPTMTRISAKGACWPCSAPSTLRC